MKEINHAVISKRLKHIKERNKKVFEIMKNRVRDIEKYIKVIEKKFLKA